MIFRICSGSSQIRSQNSIKSPSVMEFWRTCLGILAYICQNTSRDSGFWTVLNFLLFICEISYMDIALPSVHPENAHQSFSQPDSLYLLLTDRSFWLCIEWLQPKKWSYLQSWILPTARHRYDRLSWESCQSDQTAADRFLWSIPRWQCPIKSKTTGWFVRPG